MIDKNGHIIHPGDKVKIKCYGAEHIVITEYLIYEGVHYLYPFGDFDSKCLISADHGPDESEVIQCSLSPEALQTISSKKSDL